VANKELILDFSEYDLNTVVADIEQIRRINPQRYEMEQLTAIVLEDGERRLGVGYKDVTDQEFWCRGHMPGMPLMPGVVMCEAAAQLCAYLAQRYDLTGAEMVGLGGMDDIRFRDPVRPGDRLVLVAQLVKVRRNAMFICEFQGFVRESMVVEGKIRGIVLPLDAMRALQQPAQ
jgi:3-hydroxyacyl-[acyl-carrier-protein] dehydratase